MKHFAPLMLAIVTLTGPVATAQPAAVNHQTIINGKALTEQQKSEFIRVYGTPPLGGDFWYDSRSGLWGVRGREAFGVLRPGHNFGSLAPDASRGSTGVFINGRQINLAEARYIYSLFGSVIPGRWWLDGATGNFGMEGNPTPAGNMFAVARAAKSRGNGGGDYYRNDGMGSSVAITAGCATGTTGVGTLKVDFIIGCD
jgi:hypothetical protein